MRSFVALALGLSLLAGCRGAPPPAGAPPDLPRATTEQIASERAARDDAFRNATDSPIPPAARAQFAGLAYFPFDPSWQFVVRLERLAEPEPLRVVTTEGEERPAVRVGHLRFTRGADSARLAVYQLRDQSAEHWNNLFLPFKDPTSGRQTYGAGRYLDLGEGDRDWFVLDFNLAYHPACAYGGTGYQCPVTPEENRLPFPVEAGERLGAATH